MSLVFSLKNIEESWNILINPSSSPEMRNRADKFLIEFKKSEDLVDICSGLILNAKDDSSGFLGAHFLYLYIQENINDIIQSIEKYLKIKNLLLSDLIHKCDNFSLIIIKRICYSLSIILAVGSLTINTCFIEEIIEFGKSSITNCYKSVIILNSTYFEFGKLNLDNEGVKFKITTYLKEKMTLVLEFMNFLLENFNLSDDNKNYTINNNKNQLENGIINSASKITVEEIKSEILDLIQCAIKLELNILFVPRIFHTLLNSFNANNAEKISFIIADCVKYLSSSMLHDKENIYNIEILIKSIQNEHFLILEGLVFFIDDYLKNKIDSDKIFNPRNFNTSSDNNSDKDIEKFNVVNKIVQVKLDSDKIEILAALAFIFKSILENYVYLIFLDNNISQVIYDNFIFFFSCKNLRVSSKMFKPLEEICSFLRQSEFENYPQNITLNPEKTSNQIKQEISVFLMNVTGLIMFNCKFKKISIPILNKETIIRDFSKLELEEENEWDSNDPKFLTVSEYRLQAVEAYFDIFSVFIENQRKEGVQSFLAYLNEIIDNNNLLNPFELNKNTTDISEEDKKEKVHLIEVIVHLLKSIVPLISQDAEYVELLLHLSLKIFNTQVIYDEFILCSFLQFLNEIPDLVNKNKLLFKNTMELFALTMKNRQFQYISAQSVELTSEYCEEPQEEIFYLFYKTYTDYFDVYEADSLSILTSALLKFIWHHYRDGQQRVKQYTEEQLLYFIELILTPVTFSLEKINDFVSRPDILVSLNGNLNESNNEIIKQLKKTIIKNLSIYSSIFYLGHNSSEMFYKIFSLFYKKTKDILDFCYKFLNVDLSLDAALFKTINSILLVLKDLKANKKSVDLDLLFNLAEPLIHLQNILAYSYVRNPDCNECLRLFNGLLEYLILLPLDKKESLLSKCLIIFDKTEDVSKNFEDMAFLESFPSEYFNFWILIFNSGMTEIFFNLHKFNKFMDIILKLLTEYSPQVSQGDKIFNFLGNSLSFLTEFISLNTVFPKEFYEEKANRILIIVMNLIPKLFDSEIIHVVPLLTRMIKVDTINFKNSMLLMLNQDQYFSIISPENKLNIIDYLIKNSHRDSKIEQLLLNVKGFKNGLISSKFLSNLGT